MTNKQINQIVDNMTQDAAEQLGLSTATAAKGGQRETVQTLVGLQLRRLHKQVVDAAVASGGGKVAATDQVTAPALLAETDAA